MAIDCIYTLSAILNDVIIPFKKEILTVLGACRVDKMKPVREATLEAMNIIKDIGPPIEESDAGTGGSKRAKTEKQPPHKPWGKNTKNDSTPVHESDALSVNSS